MAKNNLTKQLEKTHTLCVTWLDGTRETFKHEGMLKSFRTLDVKRMERGIPLQALNGTFRLIKDWDEAAHIRYASLLASCRNRHELPNPEDNFDDQVALVSMRNEAIALGMWVEPLPF